MGSNNEYEHQQFWKCKPKKIVIYNPFIVYNTTLDWILKLKTNATYKKYNS